MSAEIGGLRAFLSANAARFESEMQKAKEAVRKSAKGMEAAMEGARRAFNGTMGVVKNLAVIAGTGATALGYMVKKQIDAADAAYKQAQAVGTTVETLTAYQYAAELSGISQEALAMAFIKTAKNAAEAAKGTGDAKGAYDALGISVIDAQGNLKNADQLITEVADKFKNMEDGAGKTALAVQLFGKSGAELIPMLNRGSAGIREMTDEAKQLGRVLDTETGQAAERFNDNLERLKAVKTGLVNQIVKSVLPTLEAFTDRMVKSAKETEGMARAGEIANTALKLLLTTGVLLKTVFDTIGTTIGAQAAALNAIAHGNFKGGFDIYKNLFTEDLPAKVKAAADSVADIWGKTADKIQAQAPENAKKMAAPIAGAADEAKKEAERVKKEAENARKAIENEIKDLEFQAKTYGMTTAQITLYRLEQAKATDGQLRAAKAALDVIAAKEAEADAFKEAGDKLTELGSRAQSFYDSTRTPAERYNETIRELNELLSVGAIDMDLFSRASQQAWDDMQKAAGKAKEEGKGFADDLKDAFSGWANNMSSTLTDVLWDSDSTFGDIATSFGKMITQMLIQTQLIKPMMEGLFGSGNESGGGLLGSLFSGGGGGGGESNLSGLGGIDTGGGLLGGLLGLIFHKGGRVGFDAVPGRLVAPEIFAHAPRLHQGLLSDEYPAILQKGESVLTPEQMAAREGGGSRPQIVMNITTPDAGSFRASQGQIMRDASFALRRWAGRNG